jgi:hypothetical protein
MLQRAPHDQPLSRSSHTRREVFVPPGVLSPSASPSAVTRHIEGARDGEQPGVVPRRRTRQICRSRASESPRSCACYGIQRSGRSSTQRRCCARMGQP